MTGTITLCDQSGVPLGQPVDAAYEWETIINVVGGLQFDLSTLDPACREDWIRYGNLVIVEHETLPAWGGVIDTPREWGRGSVTVRAYSGEHLLSYRYPQAVGQTLNGTPGAIFRQIIQMAVSSAWLPIEIGEIYEGGTIRPETLEDDLLTEVQRLAEATGCEFEFVPVLRNGRLVFVANWYDRMGNESAEPVEVIEGQDMQLSDRPYSEQGTIVNDLLGYGDGATWASRAKVRKEDGASASRYGVRQGMKGYDGSSMIGTLTENVEQELKRRAEPVGVVDVKVTNDRGAWPRLRRGNRLRALMHSVGFLGTDQRGVDRTSRIMGMGYDGKTVRIIGDE